MKLYPKDEARQMLETLFGFTYRFEAEPICKAGKFIIKNWWWEPTVQPNDKMREMIVNEIARFTEFLQIDNPQKNTIKLGV